MSFLPSSDNGAVDSNGQPIVTSYRLSIFPVGASQPYTVLNLGKPAPGSDGYITVNFSSLLSSPPLPGQTLEGKVAAVGAGGSGESTWSNTFMFDNAPTARLTSPASGATFIAPASISLTASASDGDGTISRVDFYANNSLIGSASASPYTVTWSNAAAGSYTLSAVATDNGGLKTESASVSVTVQAAGSTPAPAPAPAPADTSAASCTTVKPGADWTCYNGGWLPPGYPIPSAPVPASAPPPSSTPVASSADCTTVKPGADWTCYNGGWLPPGYPIPSAPVPASAAPAGSIPPASSAGCTTVKPGADWTCYNGGWLPPGYPVPSGLIPSGPASGTPAGSISVGSSTSCTTIKPGADWSCYNGGWLPPGYPIPSSPTGAVSSGSPTSSTACPGTDPFVAIGGGVCVAGGWRPKNMM